MIECHSKWCKHHIEKESICKLNHCKICDKIETMFKGILSRKIKVEIVDVHQRPKT
jgi:hypothetical protein